MRFQGRSGAIVLALAMLAAPGLLGRQAVAAGDAGLRSKLLHAFAAITSYRLTVLGSARSSGVFVAPDRYEITTVIDEKPIEALIIGKNYWTRSQNGAWVLSGTAGNRLDVDAAGLMRTARRNPEAPFTPLGIAMVDGKKFGAFRYSLPDGTGEQCDYDLRTYRIVRCRADEVTLLYSAFNDPKNVVAKP